MVILSAVILYLDELLQDLCEGAIYYADLIQAKLKASGYYDEVGQFDITEQVNQLVYRNRHITTLQVNISIKPFIINLPWNNQKSSKHLSLYAAPSY